MGLPPASDSAAACPFTPRSSEKVLMLESFRGFASSTAMVSKGELYKKITMPEYLRLAMKEAIWAKNVDAGLHYLDDSRGLEDQSNDPEAPLAVFINARSGGRRGPELKARLQIMMGKEQVFDLSEVQPDEFVQYGLGCLEKFSDMGDVCAKEIRKKLRVVVAGGDGTVGWVLGCLGVLHKEGRDPVPPTAIVPLGTGNDLSRSYGWGGSIPFKWKSAIKSTIDRATNGPLRGLDSWNLIVAMPEDVEDLKTPHALKAAKDVLLDQDLQPEKELLETVSYYQGVFYNYFSIGMDAQVAYGFHHLRNEKPYLAQGPIANKLIYSGYSCKQGWFFTPCATDPSLRGLNNIVRMHVKRLNSPHWEQVLISSSVRSLVALNLPNYGSGRNPWGNLKPEYLEKKGFVEAHSDDGLLEIFGLKQGWHASLVMVELISAKHIAQAEKIRFEFRGGEWNEAYMQMDGEPWKVPLYKDHSAYVEIKKVPFQSIMIKGE